MAGNGCRVFTWLLSAFLFANSWFSPNVKLQNMQEVQGEWRRKSQNVSNCFPWEPIVTLRCSRWEATWITAQRQQHRKEKGNRLTQQLKWKAAVLQVKGWPQKCSQKALGIVKVKALVHLHMQQLMCITEHLMFSDKRGFIQLNYDHKIGLGGMLGLHSRKVHTVSVWHG